MKSKKFVLPGFKLGMGIVMTYLSIIVLIPLASLLLKGSNIGIDSFFDTILNSRVISSYKVSILCSFIAAIINVIFGTILAWVLVRYKFPFKKIFDGFIDLPFALPTAVAGISLTALYSENGLFGKFLHKIGIKSSFSLFGITVALVFIGIPFVVRTLQPIISEFDKQYEEAALMLGASKFYTFRKVFLPELLPGILTGFGLAFARGIGEYGSVIFIAGNIPMKTEIVPLMIMTKLEQYDYAGASAIAIVMLILSFVILTTINLIQHLLWKRNRG